MMRPELKSLAGAQIVQLVHLIWDIDVCLFLFLNVV